MKIQTIIVLLVSLFGLASTKTANLMVKGKVGHNKYFIRQSLIKISSIAKDGDNVMITPMGQINVTKPYLFEYQLVDKNFKDDNRSYVIEVFAREKLERKRSIRFPWICRSLRCKNIQKNPSVEIGIKPLLPKSSPVTIEVDSGKTEGKRTLEELYNEYAKCYKFVGFMKPQLVDEKDGVANYKLHFMYLKFGYKTLTLNGKMLTGVPIKCK